jgi:hypothetical protein
LTQLDYRFPFFADDSMFLPAMMDMLKKDGISSLFIGAGNASYTPAMSAMADNVIFCWRDLERPSENQDSGESGQERLMLYVDRTEGQLGSEGKALFSIPVSAHTQIAKATFEGSAITLPRLRGGVDEQASIECWHSKPITDSQDPRTNALRGWHQHNLVDQVEAVTEKFRYASRRIERITEFQGVS